VVNDFKVTAMMLNATFNNISVILLRSVLLVEGTCRKSLTNFFTYCSIEYHSLWVGLKLTTLVDIGTDCTGSCKFNYHMTTTTTVPRWFEVRGGCSICWYWWYWCPLLFNLSFHKLLEYGCWYSHVLFLEIFFLLHK